MQRQRHLADVRCGLQLRLAHRSDVFVAADAQHLQPRAAGHRLCQRRRTDVAYLALVHDQLLEYRRLRQASCEGLRADVAFSLIC